MGARLSHRPYYVYGLSSFNVTPTGADLRISIALACYMLQDKEPITQPRYWLNNYSKYNIPPKALATFAHMYEKYSTWGSVSR